MDNLTETQRRLLITIINNAQGQGAKFLVHYESNLINKTPELDKWYKETKDEFNELFYIKGLLLSLENNLK